MSSNIIYDVTGRKLPRNFTFKEINPGDTVTVDSIVGNLKNANTVVSSAEKLTDEISEYIKRTISSTHMEHSRLLRRMSRIINRIDSVKDLDYLSSILHVYFDGSYDTYKLSNSSATIDTQAGVVRSLGGIKLIPNISGAINLSPSIKVMYPGRTLSAMTLKDFKFGNNFVANDTHWKYQVVSNYATYCEISFDLKVSDVVNSSSATGMVFRTESVVPYSIKVAPVVNSTEDEADYVHMDNSYWVDFKKHVNKVRVYLRSTNYSVNQEGNRVFNFDLSRISFANYDNENMDTSYLLVEDIDIPNTATEVKLYSETIGDGSVKWYIGNVEYRGNFMPVGDKTSYISLDGISYRERVSSAIDIGSIGDYSRIYLQRGVNSLRRIKTMYSVSGTTTVTIPFTMAEGKGRFTLSDKNVPVDTNTKNISFSNLKVGSTPVNAAGFTIENMNPKASESSGNIDDVMVVMTYAADTSASYSGSATIDVSYEVGQITGHKYVIYVKDKSLSSNDLSIYNSTSVSYTAINGTNRKTINNIGEFRTGDRCEIIIESPSIPSVSINGADFFAYHNDLEPLPVASIVGGSEYGFAVETDGRIYLNTLNFGDTLFNGGIEIGDITDDQFKDRIGTMNKIRYLPVMATNRKLTVKGELDGEIIIKNLSLGFK